MNVYDESESRYRHEEMLRTVARRQKFERQAAGAREHGFVAKLSDWIGTKRPNGTKSLVKEAAGVIKSSPRKAG